jgi:hypothetical protein
MAPTVPTTKVRVCSTDCFSSCANDWRFPFSLTNTKSLLVKDCFEKRNSSTREVSSIVYVVVLSPSIGAMGVEGVVCPAVGPKEKTAWCSHQASIFPFCDGSPTDTKTLV